MDSREKQIQEEQDKLENIEDFYRRMLTEYGPDTNLLSLKEVLETRAMYKTRLERLKSMYKYPDAVNLEFLDDIEFDENQLSKIKQMVGFLERNLDKIDQGEAPALKSIRNDIETELHMYRMVLDIMGSNKSDSIN